MLVKLSLIVTEPFLVLVWLLNSEVRVLDVQGHRKLSLSQLSLDFCLANLKNGIHGQHWGSFRKRGFVTESLRERRKQSSCAHEGTAGLEDHLGLWSQSE